MCYLHHDKKTFFVDKNELRQISFTKGWPVPNLVEFGRSGSEISSGYMQFHVVAIISPWKMTLSLSYQTRILFAQV